MLLVGAPVAAVKTLSDQACLLQVGELVLSHRHEVRLAEQDICSLMHRVGQQQSRHGATVRRIKL